MNMDNFAPDKLDWLPALEHPELLAEPVAVGLTALAESAPDLASQALVAEIDPAYSDTEPLAELTGMPIAMSCNCVLVAGKRAGDERVAACLIRANTRADINHVVKKRLGVRKASFWPMDEAVAQSGMEYGGITPIGIPAGWHLYVDPRATEGDALIGSGVRRSKLAVPGALLAALPGVEIIEGLGIE